MAAQHQILWGTVVGPCKGGSRDSGFKFQTDRGWQHAGILNSNLKLMEFRIQIWAYRALGVLLHSYIKALH